MATSRAVLILGMHRSGTSAVARGMAALSVYLGDDFLDAQPENPTGYWEDKGVVATNERLLKLLGLAWDDVSPIERREFERWRVRWLRREAIGYVRRSFSAQPLWGFKDPRTIRLLPFWRRVLVDCAVDDSYVVVIRNPRSVAASLFARQAMDATQAYRLWLAHMIPFLGDLRGKPLAVVDYDLLMGDPRGQLDRIARLLGIPPVASSSEIDRFVGEFLDQTLRHSAFSAGDLDADSEAARLTRDAYLLLWKAAADRLMPETPAFWSEWETVRVRLRTEVPEPRPASKKAEN